MVVREMRLLILHQTTIMNHLTIFFLLLFALNLQSQDPEDWANLKKYYEANQMVMADENNDGRVVFMGNSITEGWIGARPEFFKNNPYINRGISGQTTPQMLIRFRMDVVDLNPEVVVILAGTNDIAGNTGPSSLGMIMDNLQGMAEIADANKIKVVLCSVMPVYDYPWSPGLNPNIKIPALNKLIEAYANEKGFVYLDYFAAMEDGKAGMREELTYDGVHLTEGGYEYIEPMVQKAIAEALKK